MFLAIILAIVGYAVAFGLLLNSGRIIMLLLLGLTVFVIPYIALPGMFIGALISSKL